MDVDQVEATARLIHRWVHPSSPNMVCPRCSELAERAFALHRRR